MDALARAPTRRPTVEAATILGIATATIAGAFAFQAAGYAPCELCLQERLPYYAGILVAAIALAASASGRRGIAAASFCALAAVFLFSAAFGAYHAGVEWGLWQGPSACTGAMRQATSTADFLQQLRTVKIVRCDAVAIRVLGLSLAGWNVVVSLTLAAGAALVLRRLARA